MSDNSTALPFYEDFKVGDVFPAGQLKVTLEMTQDFATKYDPQPIHLDEEAARESIFGVMTGSGWHTAALAMRQMVLAKPFGDRPIIGLGVQDLKFNAPLKPDDTLGFSGEIIKAWRSRSKPMGFYHFHITVTNQDNVEMFSETWTTILPTRDKV